MADDQSQDGAAEGTPDGAPEGTPDQAEDVQSQAPGASDADAEALLRAAQEAVDSADGDTPAGAEAGSGGDGSMSEAEIEAMMMAQLAGEGGDGQSAGDGAVPFQPPAFDVAGAARADEPLDLLSDVNLNVKIELGRTRMVVEDVLKLGEGAVIELDKLAGDPVDVYVNERLVARGEVLILSDNFCVRVNEIISDEGNAAKSA